MISFIDASGNELVLDNGLLVAILAIVLVVSLGMYLLRSFGLYKLAKKENLPKAFLAFIPGVWMYTACKIAREARFFRTTIGRVALVFTIIFASAFYLSKIFELLVYIPVVGYYLGGGEKIVISYYYELQGIQQSYLSGIYLGADFVSPYSGVTAYKVLDGVNTVAQLFMRVGDVAAVFVYFGIFRKYWPEFTFFASIFSFLGLFPIFIFIIRNKEPFDYDNFVRTARYGNPYGNNPYGRNEVNNNFYDENNRDKTPFSDFDDSPSDDPFSDFDDKGDK